MNANEVARALLATIPLPSGTVAIMPWNEDGKIVMRVLVDRPYVNQVKVPPKYKGFDVVVGEKQNLYAHH